LTVSAGFAVAAFWKAKCLTLQLQIDQATAYSVASLTAMTLASSAASCSLSTRSGVSPHLLADQSSNALSTDLPPLAPVLTSPPTTGAATCLFANQEFEFSPIVGAKDFVEGSPAPDVDDCKEYGLQLNDQDVVTPAKCGRKKRKTFEFTSVPSDQ
jgi:hypothetical protein